MANVKALIFDVDGVLADSREANYNLFAKLFSEFGFVPPKPHEIDALGGQTSRETICALVPGIEEPLLSEMLAKTSELAKEAVKGIRKTELAEALPGLSSTYSIAVVTNRRKPSTDALLSRFGIAQHLSAMMTCEDGEPKPSPDLLNKALAKMSVQAHEALYFGDSECDKQAAEAAGIRMHMVSAQTKKEEISAILSQR